MTRDAVVDAKIIQHYTSLTTASTSCTLLLICTLRIDNNYADYAGIVLRFCSPAMPMY